MRTEAGGYAGKTVLEKGTATWKGRVLSESGTGESQEESGVDMAESGGTGKLPLIQGGLHTFREDRQTLFDFDGDGA